MYLLSSYGERHEDRIPIGIFSSLDTIEKYLIEDEDEFFIDRGIVGTDYNNSATEFTLFYCSEKEFNKLSEDHRRQLDYEIFIAEEWELDAGPLEFKCQPQEIPQIPPIVGFTDPHVRRNWKDALLKVLEFEDDGLTPYQIRVSIGRGNEPQVRDLLAEMVRDNEILKFGQTKGTRYLKKSC